MVILIDLDILWLVILIDLGILWLSYQLRTLLVKIRLQENIKTQTQCAVLICVLVCQLLTFVFKIWIFKSSCSNLLANLESLEDRFLTFSCPPRV